MKNITYLFILLFTGGVLYSCNSDEKMEEMEVELTPRLVTILDGDSIDVSLKFARIKIEKPVPFEDLEEHGLLISCKDVDENTFAVGARNWSWQSEPLPSNGMLEQDFNIWAENWECEELFNENRCVWGSASYTDWTPPGFVFNAGLLDEDAFVTISKIDTSEQLVDVKYEGTVYLFGNINSTHELKIDWSNVNYVIE